MGRLAVDGVLTFRPLTLRHQRTWEFIIAEIGRNRYIYVVQGEDSIYV